jgi:hypothetical protein
VTGHSQEVNRVSKVSKATEVTPAGACRTPGSCSAVPSSNGAENLQLFGRVTVIVVLVVVMAVAVTMTKTVAMILAVTLAAVHN